MPFQTSVSVQPAPGVEGDFCDANPRASVNAGPGAFVAGAAGVTIGRFAWAQASPLDPDGAPSVVNSFGTGPVTGFVHREQQGLITTYLTESGMTIPPGFGVTLMKAGGYWVKNNGTTTATPGMLAYADYATGKANFAAAASGSTGGSGTASSIAASTGSFTGSISGNVLTITAVGSGVVVPGGTLSGTSVVTGTQVVAQLSGTAGGIGTYSVNIGEQTVASTTISETYGTLTIGGTVAGASFAVGQTVSGSGVTAGTTITALGTGTGGAGTYIVSPTQTASSTTITAGTNVVTKWIAMSSGLPGELVKISSTPNG